VESEGQVCLFSVYWFDEA